MPSLNNVAAVKHNSVPMAISNHVGGSLAFGCAGDGLKSHVTHPDGGQIVNDLVPAGTVPHRSNELPSEQYARGTDDGAAILSADAVAMKAI
jgi:hypothetical protein